MRHGEILPLSFSVAPDSRQKIAVATINALEQLRKEPELEWSFLAPPAQLQPGTRTGKFRLGKDQLLVDANGESWISVQDYAVAMIDELEPFIIDTRTNCISIRAAVQDSPDMANAEQFGDAGGLATLAASWPTARLVEIWNRLPGARPVARFTDRKTAVGRIWKALEGLDEALPTETASAPDATLSVPPSAHKRI